MLEYLIGAFEALGLYSSANGLGEHLRGLDAACEGFNNQSIYNSIFLTILFVNGIIVANYYYGIFNRVKFSSRVWWAGNILVAAIIVFIIAYSSTSSSIAYGVCSNLNIGENDIVGFAITSSIFSIIFGFILSLLIKSWSSQNKIVPI